MLHTSGVPGSVLPDALGIRDRRPSLAQIDSGDSSRPTVLPIDFDIFACPSSPMTRGVGVSSGSGSGKNCFALVGPILGMPSGRSGEHRVPPARQHARQFEMLNLILANGHLVGAIQQNVRRLEHRIVQDPGGDALLSLRLLLELRLPFELPERRDGIENPRQLGMFRHLRLHVQRRDVGIDARGEQRQRHLMPPLRAVGSARTPR